jgi:anti-sigma factor RsiW
VTCREFADFMADYLSGELLPETTAQFEHHLTVCPNCVAYLSNYRDTVALGRQAFADGDAAVPDEVPDDLVNAILSARTKN